MNKFYNKFRRACAWITGAVFAFSGILKLMDFVGTGLIVTEYFKFFHIAFLTPIAGPAGFLLALAEAVTGIGLMSGVWRKIFAITASALTLFFTFITILLVIFNPSMDCGCFGEAIHLTHLQTLIKNLVLVSLCLAAFLPFRDLGEPRPVKTVTFAIGSISLLFFGIISARTLPFKDFTSLRTGVTVAAAESEGCTMPKFDAEYIYEKDGIRKTFTMEELPDSTWTFVDVITIENKDTKEAPILSIVDSLGVTCDSLAAEGKVLISSVYKPEKIRNENDWNKIEETLAAADSLGVKPLLLAAGTREGAFASDYRTLVSLNRSNGGYTLLDNGLIIRKWPAANAPDKGTLKDAVSDDPLDVMTSYETKGDMIFQAFLLYLFAILILL